MQSPRLGSDKHQFYKSFCLTQLGFKLSTFRTGSLRSVEWATESGVVISRLGCEIIQVGTSYAVPKPRVILTSWCYLDGQEYFMSVAETGFWPCVLFVCSCYKSE